MESRWPVLSYAKGKSTYDTVHMWTQIVGKIKLALLPWVNHSWHVALLITPKGFSSGPLPYQDRSIQIDLDFLKHELQITCSSGEERSFSLQGISVADFYTAILEQLAAMNIDVSIRTTPSEVADPIVFDKDYNHASYELAEIHAMHIALQRIQAVFIKHRSGFQGKTSPIHFFWGSFDLALSFFSGKGAPKHPGGVPGLPDWIAEEAYCREVCSCGFWTGNESFPEAAFYCYLYPEPTGFKESKIGVNGAYYHPEMGEFILPYSAVQAAEFPEQELLKFLQGTYTAGAELAKWDRVLLESISK